MSVYPQHSVWQSPLPGELEIDLFMKFRLTYEGPLLASQPQNESANKSAKQVKLSNHKQELRKHFHGQLKRLWETNKALLNMKFCASCGVNHDPISANNSMGFGRHDLRPIREHIIGQYQRNGYNFCPLVCDDFELLCKLDILFLRQDIPGSALNGAGDVDNRVKTLIDALKMPSNLGQLGDFVEPSDGEDPFYCLLVDDSQVSAFAVETDTLLTDGVSGDMHGRDCKLIISVELRPYNPTFVSLAFS